MDCLSHFLVINFLILFLIYAKFYLFIITNNRNEQEDIYLYKEGTILPLLD